MATNSSINSANPIQIALGGTAVASNTDTYSVIFAGTTSTAPLQTIAVGISGTVLTSSGSGLPSWGNIVPIGTINGNTSSVTGATVTVKTETASAGGSVFTNSSATSTLSFNSGTHNTFLGPTNTGHVGTSTGTDNVGLGQNALAALTSGNYNVCIDGGAGITTGYNNVCIGTGNGITTGHDNTLIGSGSGRLASTGSFNICIGNNGSGYNFTTQSNNLILGGALGGSTDANKTNIGFLFNTTAQIKCFIDGINGATVSGTAVLVSSAGKLGVAVSSDRYKENIKDLRKQSIYMHKLRPVTFTYKGQEDTRYGLIAEEVTQVYPNLITYTSNGEILSVMYHELPILILNEMKFLKKKIELMKTRLAKLEMA